MIKNTVMGIRNIESIEDVRKWGTKWRERAREAEGRLKREATPTSRLSKEQEVNWATLAAKVDAWREKAELYESDIKHYRLAYENGRRARKAGTVFVFDAADAWKLGYESMDRELKIKSFANERLTHAAARLFDRTARLATIVGYEPEDHLEDGTGQPYVDRLIDRVELEMRAMRQAVQSAREMMISGLDIPVTCSAPSDDPCEPPDDDNSERTLVGIGNP